MTTVIQVTHLNNKYLYPRLGSVLVSNINSISSQVTKIDTKALPSLEASAFTSVLRRGTGISGVMLCVLSL